MKQLSSTDTSKTQEQTKAESKLAVTLSKSPQLDASALETLLREFNTGYEQKYTDVLLRVFNVKELLNRLKTLLSKLGITQLFLFIDDFSELPEDAMRIVVETLLAPMNNWSDELIKLKVAAYPGRIFYGSIDKTKIDELYLDVFKAYGTNDVNAMEDKAIDFTRRLVMRRIGYFCKTTPDQFFDLDLEEIWRVLFYTSMGNPRILGYILYYLYETQLIYGVSIGLRSIRDNARRYYEEKVEAYFAMRKFLHEAFDERSSIFSLKELLEQLVSKAKQLRRYRESSVMQSILGQPPSSHFHVPTTFDSILSTLELNFFLTKYFEMSNRDGIKVSVYALNYGLCQKHTIEFGRPRDKREYRTYFIERIFDYSHIIAEYIKSNQEIACNNPECGEKYGLEKLEALQMYDMQCPKCRTSKCRIINLSRKYEMFLRDVSHELLLPETELNILHALHSEKRPLFAIEIAGELDCSYQLVGKRGKFLAEKDLVNRDVNMQGRPEFSLNQRAEDIYFSDTSEILDVPE